MLLQRSQVPGILFTPICPHSLSFRPLIFPEYVTIRIQVPFNSRGHAWASFDGKDRKQLAAGDALVCSMAPWPVPTACQVDSTNDFLRSIHDGLHWNLRKTQSFDGPRDAWPNHKASLYYNLLTGSSWFSLVFILFNIYLSSSASEMNRCSRRKNEKENHWITVVFFHYLWFKLKAQENDESPYFNKLYGRMTADKFLNCKR